MNTLVYATARSAFSFGGLFRVSGQVSRVGVAGSYLVRLFERNSGALVAKTWSRGDGAYVFNGVADREYFVVAFDHTGNPVNAAISDYVTPEPMA